jgi:hypothetical protein
MKRSASLLAVALLAGTACSVDTQSSIVIDGFFPLTFDDGSTACVPGDQDNPITSGTYDAGLGQLGVSYYTYVLVRNNLPDNSDNSAGRLNSNDFQLRSLEVTIDNAKPWQFLPSKQIVNASAGVRVAGTSFVPVPLISPTLAASMVQGSPAAPSPIANEGSQFAINVRVRAKGVLNDGSEVESNEMSFPMTISNHKLGNPCQTNQLLSGCTVVDTAQGTFPVQSDGWTCVTP